jgi:hypothetical protein
MIEYKTPLDSFIGGWIINKEICEDLIKFFKKNKKRQIDGKVSGVRPNLIDHEIKKSIDLSLHGSDSAFKSYNEQLQICLNKYMDRYPEVFNDYAKFNSTIENYNIQKYDPNEGFYKWHCERNNGQSKRCLVFMTYLNDVNKGGTEFKYQKLTTIAKCGLTLIWPTDFTHMHRGEISEDETKYIITGWYNYE